MQVIRAHADVMQLVGMAKKCSSVKKKVCGEQVFPIVGQGQPFHARCELGNELFEETYTNITLMMANLADVV